MRLFKRKSQDDFRKPNPSGSANVFSYYTSRSRTEQKTGRGQQIYNEQHHHGWLRRLFSWQGLPALIATGVIVGSLSYLLWVDTNPRIEIVSEGQAPTLLQDINVYEEAGKEILSGSPLNRFKLTVDTPAIARELRSRFPELSDVVIIVPVASHRLVFEIQPAAPALIMASSQYKAFVVDEQGRAVVEAERVMALSELSLPVVQDESGLEIETGKVALPKEDVEFIRDVTFQLRAKGMAIKSLGLPRVANELHIFPEGEQYFVKFNMTGDARVQAGVFMAVKERLQAEGRAPSSYIDVRIEEKAFYK
jgi:hypothetical protein